MCARLLFFLYFSACAVCRAGRYSTLGGNQGVGPPPLDAKACQESFSELAPNNNEEEEGNASIAACVCTLLRGEGQGVLHIIVFPSSFPLTCLKVLHPSLAPLGRGGWGEIEQPHL